MCKKILDAKIPGIHMYTLNLERSAVAILENVGLITKTKVPPCAVLVHHLHEIVMRCVTSCLS